MKKLTKQGQVAGIQGFIMAIVGVAVILAVGLIVLSELQTYSEAANATGTIITKLATVPTWIGILITVALAFIVLGYFYTRG